LKLWDANPDQAKTFVAQAKEMGSTALYETRQAVATLRQMPLSQQDLAGAIAPLTQRLQQVTGVVPDLVVDCPSLPESLKLTVYRIVQEALTNICKYAQATQVSIAIQSSPDRSDCTLPFRTTGWALTPRTTPPALGWAAFKNGRQPKEGRCS
jgi:signal transduction histidine kinase